MKRNYANCWRTQQYWLECPCGMYLLIDQTGMSASAGDSFQCPRCGRILLVPCDWEWADYDAPLVLADSFIEGREV